MKPRVSISCVALLSGGLDSILAVRVMQQLGINVEALNFQTLFACCRDQAGQAARQLGVPLTVVGDDDDYLDLIRKPARQQGNARDGYARRSLSVS